jgi:multicomponent Na+:H+ antiporter subunit C
VSYLPYLLAVWLFLVGLYGVVTSRHLVHLAVCLTVTQSSTYVLLLAIGFRTGGTSPIFKGLPRKARVGDPVVQALTLTDIVVSVVVLALVLALALQAHRDAGTADPNRLHAIRG